MSLFDKIKLLEKNKDNPDQLSLDLDGANDKRSKAQKFTDKINKAREERRKLKTGTDGKRARRVINATGEKKTGSFSRGNLSLPGDKSGAYQAAKSDLEARKGFKDVKPGGLKADEKNPYVKRSVRRGRVKDLGGDIFDQPKFSQKEFDKSIGGSKKPTDAAAPGDFGKPKTKKTFKNFRQDQGFNAKKTAIKDIRASEKRLYDAGVGKKPSLVQQRKFAKDVIRKAQAKQQAEFNRQQRLYRQYDAYDDGDLGNPEFSKSKPKNVKFSSGAKGKFASGSPEMGGESKKFASRNRTPAPQVNKPVVNRTPPKVDPKFAKDAIPVSKTPFDPNPKNASRRTVNYSDTDKPIKPVSKKVKNSKGIGNIYRDNKALKKLRIDQERAAAGFNKEMQAAGPTKSKPVGQSNTLDNRLINKTGSRNFSSKNPNVKGPVSRIDPDLSRMSSKDRATYQKIKDTTPKGGIPKWMKNFDKKYPIKNLKTGSKSLASKILKTGPLKKYAIGAALVGAGLYGADRIRKQLFPGKTKNVPAIKSDVIRYKQGVTKDGKDVSGKKKYFDLSKDFKKGYITKDDFKDMDPNSKTYGQVDAGFDKKKLDDKQKRIRSAANKK